MITPDEIRAVVDQLSELPATASADDYLMEKFQRVAIEAVAAFAANKGDCPTDDLDICRAHGGSSCRACWREALKREGK